MMQDITLIKNALRGRKLTLLMKRKKTNKYRISKATGVVWNTLWTWETERATPSDDKAILVAKFLGLIKDSEEILKLKDEMKTMQERLDQIEA